jgi:hypothetical protein
MVGIHGVVRPHFTNIDVLHQISALFAEISLRQLDFFAKPPGL